jgi:hypothetical protein
VAVLNSSRGVWADAWLKRKVGHARAWVGGVTVILLLFAFAIGVAGLSTDSGRTDFHLIVETIAVMAALTGVFWERRFVRVERRNAAIRAVREELVANIELVEKDPGFKPQDHRKPEPCIYPRVAVGAVVACLAQAVLREDGDAKLIEELARWRNEAQTFNRTIGVIELVCYGVSFSSHDAARVIINADRELQEERVNFVTETRRALSALPKSVERLTARAVRSATGSETRSGGHDESHAGAPTAPRP